MARFRPPQSTGPKNSFSRQVLASLLTAHPSQRLRAYPTFRLLSQPPACHHSAPLLSAARRGTEITSPPTAFFLRRLSSPLSLPQVRGTDDSYRASHRRRNPTSCSTTGHRCGMTILFPTRTLRPLWRALHFLVSLPNTSLPITPVTPLLATVSHLLFNPPQPLLRSAPQSRHTNTPLLPTIEFP